jgi:hypothetical protein
MKMHNYLTTNNKKMMNTKVNRFFKFFFLTLIFLLISIGNEAFAQCAMCRGSLESSVSEGTTSIAAGINKGILYLLVMPYLIMGTLAYLWYKNSKENQEKMRKIYQRLHWNK